MRQNFLGDAPSSVTDAEQHLLTRFADQNFDWWWLGVFVFRLLQHRLHGISEELSDHVFHVAQYVGKCCLEVSFDLDLRDIT